MRIPNFVLQPRYQLFLYSSRHVGISAFIVREPSYMELVSFASMCHLGYEITVGCIRKIFSGGFARVLALDNLDLISCGDNHFLGHVSHNFVHHEQYGDAKLLGQVEGTNRQIEAFLGRVRTKCNDLIVAMGSPAGLHHVRLRRERGESGGGPSTLHVYEYARSLSHGSVSNVFHHERKTRTGCHRKSL